MKTRQVERHRLVPHTVDGETELVVETQYEDVPLPPRDWDQIVRTAVTIGAGLLVTVSVIWSTASIGELLNKVVVAGAAYGAAIAFDLLWIMCTAAEWLLRTDPGRARLARWGGVVALLIAMSAVFANGYLSGQWVIGAVGAVVSALAKGGTALAMIVHARPLDPRTQQWLAKRRAALNGQLAMIPVRRELQRGQAMVEAERRALAMTAAPDRPDADPDQSGPSTEDPEPNPLPTLAGPMTVKDAVRTALDSGITEPDAVLRFVRTRADANAKPETVARYIRLAKLAG